MAEKRFAFENTGPPFLVQPRVSVVRCFNLIVLLSHRGVRDSVSQSRSGSSNL
jgi:hypothetical protein